MEQPKYMDSSRVNLEEMDLTNPYLYSKGNPHLIWHAMRHRSALHWQQVREDLGFWSVTKYDDAVRVLKDHETFTSEKGTLLNLLGMDDPAGGRQMVVTDPPRHTQLRRPLQHAFSSHSLATLIEPIRSEVYKVLEPAFEGERFDFARASTFLSTAVAGMLLGLPGQDWPMLTQLTTMAVAPDDIEVEEDHGGSKETLERAHRELFAYFQDMINQRQRHPGNDPISILLNMEIDGQRLRPGAVISNCYSILLGATVTTPHVSSASLLELIQVGSYEDWVLHPEFLSSGVEEAFRWSSPASHFMRYATQDVDIRNTKIKKGDAVVVWLGSANRDEEVFDEPFTFNIRRNPNPHIAFGSGPHHCIGHVAARQTLRILFEELLTHFDRFELGGDVEYMCSNFISGIKSLPLIGHIRPEAQQNVPNR